MALHYQVTLTPDQFQHIRDILVSEAEELLVIDDSGFTEEQKEIVRNTKAGIEELLEMFTPTNPDQHEHYLNRG